MAHRMIAALVALLCLALSAPASAAPKDAVLNKEGVWGVDVDGQSCAASMSLPDGAIFLLRANEGEVNVALFARAKIAKGKVLRIETEAYGFDVKPGFGDTAVYSLDAVDARTLAALRLARQVRLLVDGRLVAVAEVEKTGLEQALDGVIACSKGQAGWWGKGVQLADAGGKSEAVLNKEGFWVVAADPKSEICTAVVSVEGGGAFVLIADGRGRYTFGLGGGEPLKKGRQGRFEIDSLAFDFRPGYDGKDYLYSLDELDSQAMFVLRRAKGVRISVDRRPVLEMTLEGSGHAQVIDDVAACARGVAGWWGAGLKAAP